MFRKIFQHSSNKNSKGKLYPEIENAGGLNQAIDNEFIRVGSQLRIFVDENMDKLPFTYSRVVNKNKYSQIYIAQDEKLYLPDFWRDGVCLAHGQFNNISELINALDYWLQNDISTAQLAERFSTIFPSEKAESFDQNNEIEYTWRKIQNDPDRKELKEFVDLAIKDEIVGQLFPFTSLMRLCFSRCTGFPYTHDTPIVIPIDGQFEIRSPKNELLGNGTASEALQILKDNLPKNIKPAIKGTAEDLNDIL